MRKKNRTAIFIKKGKNIADPVVPANDHNLI